MVDASDKNSWSDYWRAAAYQEGSGCLPGADPRINELLGKTWQSFAEKLPSKAKVVDLGTGDGAVLRQLNKARRDLKLAGVDYAENIRKLPKGAKLHSGTLMEDLPFQDASIGGICSQFGFEYADRKGVIAEVARVLAPRGSLQILAHHTESIVVTSNRQRSKELEWALEERGVITKAKAFLQQRARLGIAVPPVLNAILKEADEKFGRAGGAFEFTLGTIRVLQNMSEPAPVQNQALDFFARQNRSERQRIGQMMRVACAEPDIAEITSLFAEQEVAVDAAPLQPQHLDRPIGWLLKGHRAAT